MKAKSVKLEYRVVTPAATKKVTEQVGYEVIILDCKCFLF